MKYFSDGGQYLEASFGKLELVEKLYKDIEFEECGFSGCDFTGATFRDCKFFNCKFDSCNLSLIDLPGCGFFGVTFRECKLLGVDWTKATWAAYRLDFEMKFQRCMLNDSSFFGLTLNELRLDECQLHDVDFREGNFSGSVMTGCDFTRSLFMRTNLQRVDFRDSSNYAINVLENQVKGAKFSRYEALGLLECLEIELVD